VGKLDQHGKLCRVDHQNRWRAGEILSQRDQAWRTSMANGQTSSAIATLRTLRGFAFDLDGTIWEGPALMPGAVELVQDLRHAQIGVIFASNCSRSGSSELSQRLAELGIAATPSEVLTPFDLVGGEVRRRLGPVPVLVVGNDELGDVLAAAGHTKVPFDRWEDSRAVVVGVDLAFDYERLRAASRAVAAGAAFFAINLDARFPVGPGAFDPGCGALAQAIAVAGGGKPIAIGKPETTLFRVAIERLGCPARQAAMVGDSTASDIKGGRAAGMFTIWLDPEDDEPRPDSADLKVRDLAELHRLWRS
jgi:HAD superfamily hydrolase (TIGR01450 family)